MVVPLRAELRRSPLTKVSSAAHRAQALAAGTPRENTSRPAWRPPPNAPGDRSRALRGPW